MHTQLKHYTHIICSRTDRHTHKQTDGRVDHNTLHPSQQQDNEISTCGDTVVDGITEQDQIHADHTGRIVVFV